MQHVTRTLFFACLLAACGGDAGSSDMAAGDDAAGGAAAPTASEPQARGGEACVAGTYQMPENGVTKSFTFRADHTGEEVESPPETRPFTWSLTDEHTVHIVYDAVGDVQSTAWDLVFNCEQNTIRFYGATYTRS